MKRLLRTNLLVTMLLVFFSLVATASNCVYDWDNDGNCDVTVYETENIGRWAVNSGVPGG